LPSRSVIGAGYLDKHTAEGRKNGRGLEDFKKTETAALANKSDVPDFQPPLLPAAAVTVTLTEEPVRYLAALLDREENSIAADLRAMLAATATTSRLVPETNVAEANRGYRRLTCSTNSPN